MSAPRINLSERQRELLGAGNPDDLILTLVQLAADWMRKAGSHIALRDIVPAVQIAVGGEKGAVLAAALDLLAVLELTPQGRKALADFGGKPLLQETKCPGG